MPLRCLSLDSQELAFRHDAQSWSILRERNRLERHLRLPCCQAAVVLKVSRLGTRFFAHQRRGTCTTAAESPEHLLLKDIVARAAIEAGWKATTEVRGTSSVGEDWVADILCTREGSTSRVAVEIQWTRQTLDDTAERQRRYRDSGVRALWLMRQSDVPASEEIPAFTVRFGEDTTAEVLLPSADWPPNGQLHLFGRAEPRWGQRIRLNAFITGALQGRLRFAPAMGRTVPASVMGAMTKCWKCGQETRLFLGIDLLLERIYPGFGNVHITLAEIGKDPERGALWMAAHFPVEALVGRGIGAVKLRYSRTMSERYLSNGCLHCDALQGCMFEHEVAFESTPLWEVFVPIESWMADEREWPASLKRWWFHEEVRR